MTYTAVSSLEILNDLSTRIARDAEGKRAAFSLHEMPASELHLGDVLLDDDYNPLGTISKAEVLAGIVWVKCVNPSQAHIFQLDPDDIVAVLRSAS